MRARTALLALVIVAAGCGGGKKSPAAPGPAPRPTPSPNVKIFAATHRPQVNVKWRYEVRASGGPRKLTVQIVDPAGGVHPVQYDGKKRNVTNVPFKGAFKDYLEFPPESRGYKLVVRATVKTARGRGVATYTVRPK